MEGKGRHGPKELPQKTIRTGGRDHSTYARKHHHQKPDRIASDLVTQRKLGPRSKGRKKVKTFYHSKNKLTIDSHSLCGPDYHWGGLLTAKAEEAKKCYRAIRSNVVGKKLPDSDKIPTGQLDLQFLVYWIKENAWDITLRLF